jgi:hypothetical protein
MRQKCKFMSHHTCYLVVFNPCFMSYRLAGEPDSTDMPNRIKLYKTIALIARTNRRRLELLRHLIRMDQTKATKNF